MSKVKNDEMELRDSVWNLHLVLAHFKININKSISSSPFCTPWCIVVFYFYCCLYHYRVNISVCSPVGHFRSFSNSILRNRGIDLAVHQSICLLLRWTSCGITFFGTGPSSYKSFGKHLTGIFSVAINMLALLCEVDMVQCAQSHVAPPAAESFLSPPCMRLYLQRRGMCLRPLLSSNMSCGDSSDLCWSVHEHGGNM